MSRFLAAFCILASLVAMPAVAQTSADTAEALFAATLADLDDKPAALAAWKGKPLVVNFWARWCGPCRQEIPELAKARVKYKARGIEVLGLGLEDKPEAVREFAKAYDMEYPVFLTKDQGIPLMQALGNAKAGLPFTLAVDRQGRIVYRKLGGMKKADIEAAVEAALR